MRYFNKPFIITCLVIFLIIIFIYGQKNYRIRTLSSSSPLPSKAIVIAYQTGIDPTKVAQAKGLYKENSQQNIHWKKFDTGADIINALASGDVDIGNIGTSPLAAAAGRNVPIEVFFIAAKLGRSEALVVRDTSPTLKALIGKTIAVPLVSTSHYSLLAAMKSWQIDESQVKIVYLRPSEITAAWQRGDIDAAYVWEPTLSHLTKTGRILIDSSEVAHLGMPTFDIWVTRKDFAQKNPDFLQHFVDTSLKQINLYNQDPNAYQNNMTYLQALAHITGADIKDIPLLLAGNQYLNQQQQFELLNGQFANEILKTARFLQSQGKLAQVKTDYRAHITTQFIQN